MFSPLKRILATFITLLFGFAGLVAQPAEFQKVEQSIENHIEAGDMVGISVAYIAPDGSVSYLNKGKLAKGSDEGVNRNTIFEIGSATKVVTALALADLMNEKGIAPDEPAENYLPAGFDLPEYDGQPITISHLLTHTSGLPKIPNNLPKKNPDPYALYSNSDFQKYLKNLDLQRKPGSEFQYSNSGTGLAGLILEEQLDTSYAAAVNKRIASPLQMESTTVKISDADSIRFAEGYRGNNRAAYWHFDALAGAGALQSTPSDMITFLKAQMGIIESDLNPVMDKTQEAHFDIGSENKMRAKAGMGWLFSTQHDSILWHDGGTGGFTSIIGINKEKGSGVVILNNTTHPVHDLGFHLLDGNHSIEEVEETVALSKDQLSQYTGEYKVNNNISYYVTVEGGQLYFQVTGQNKIPFYPKSETRFFCKQIPAEIEFTRREGGTVEKVTLFQSGQEIEAQKRDAK